MIAAHKSDILRYMTVLITGTLPTNLARYLMLYKFGGIYLDLDFVTLNPITQYQNIVVTGKRKPGEWRVNLNF